YSRDAGHLSEWRAKYLPRIEFVNIEDYMPFGFLDPINVIRGCHVIPAFAYGQTDDLLPPSIACLPTENDKDWIYYYVNISVDHDMIMCYRGGGVGHESTRAAINAFLED
ncbi:hypothetical protein BDN70DRAFT_818524, partial [Pholiota conissans]